MNGSTVALVFALPALAIPPQSSGSVCAARRRGFPSLRAWKKIAWSSICGLYFPTRNLYFSRHSPPRCASGNRRVRLE